MKWIKRAFKLPLVSLTTMPAFQRIYELRVSNATTALPLNIHATHRSTLYVDSVPSTPYRENGIAWVAGLTCSGFEDPPVQTVLMIRSKYTP